MWTKKQYNPAMYTEVPTNMQSTSRNNKQIRLKLQIKSCHDTSRD